MSYCQGCADREEENERLRAEIINVCHMTGAREHLEPMQCLKQIQATLAKRAEENERLRADVEIFLTDGGQLRARIDAALTVARSTKAMWLDDTASRMVKALRGEGD